MLGEYIVGSDPDCTTSCAPPKITRKVVKTIIHEDYNTAPPFSNDIALIRLDEAVPLYEENPGVSLVVPVCLPWNENNPGNNLNQGDEMLIFGWGRITNDRQTIGTNLLRFKVSTRTLKKHYERIAGKDCSTQEIVKKKFDFSKQFCAGDEIRKYT